MLVRYAIAKVKNKDKGEGGIMLLKTGFSIIVR